MKKICFLLAFWGFQSCFAQTAEDSVKATIHQLFAAMKSSNAIALKDCFTDSAIMQTIVKDAQGNRAAKTNSVKDFVQQIAALPANAADEQIVIESIQIDGALASVWTPYQFFYNGQFSHCGVNHFVLLKVNHVWRIQYLIDTRRRQGCKQ